MFTNSEANNKNKKTKNDETVQPERYIFHKIFNYVLTCFGLVSILSDHCRKFEINKVMMTAYLVRMGKRSEKNCAPTEF
jgi:hypothetical protein